MYMSDREVRYEAESGLALAVLAVVVLCALAGICLTYPIKLDQATLPGHLADFYDRGAARPCLLR